MKKILIFIDVIGVFLGTVYFINKKEAIAPIDTSSVVVEKKPIQLCFYGEKKTQNNFYDVAWLKMNLLDEKVTGEFRNLPAEKDSKVGTFEGIVGAVDKIAMARTADVWWNSFAEGMQVKEQLKIIFGEGTANVNFGEMADRGDGVYIYKDEAKLTYGMSMTDVACGDIDERIVVEKYVRDNIKTIVSDKPVLGGSWYVTMVRVNPTLKTGEMSYEDGHIMGKVKTFSYIIDGSKVIIAGLNGRNCYEYNQVATTEAPYKVEEKIDITRVGDKMTGTKSGTQAGPDMTNGYKGTLVGTVSGDVLTAIYSYVIEGSAQKEKEIYSIQSNALVKHRYALKEEKRILVPDMESEVKDVIYTKVACVLK
jgi:hypothetical protein